MERELAKEAFCSLTLVRPGVIAGEREQIRPGEQVLAAALKLAGPLLPLRWRLNPAAQIARALLTAAIRRQPGTHIVGAELLV